MAAAIAHPNCSNENPLLNAGNNVRACPPLAPFVKDGSEPKCTGLSVCGRFSPIYWLFQVPVPLTENLGARRPIKYMPGCYDINGTVSNCDKSPQGADNAGTFFIKANNGNLLTAVKDGVVYASDANLKTSKEVKNIQNNKLTRKAVVLRKCSRWPDHNREPRLLRSRFGPKFGTISGKSGPLGVLDHGVPLQLQHIRLQIQPHQSVPHCELRRHPLL